MERILKRVFDFILAIILGVIAIPILMISCVFVYLLSPESSPIFRQVRIGYMGKPFTMLKLRTMTNEMDAEGNLLPDDRRLKWWGKCIRKTNIDELTQIVHILTGEMSFIGPRPLLPKEMLVMTTCEQKQRQSVLPGIVGWESVNEEKSSSRAEMAQYDLYYVKNWSLFLDCKIFLLTAYKLFSFSRPDDALRAPKLLDAEINAAMEKDEKESQNE